VHIDDLRRRFAGELVLPADPAYDAARRVWNGSVDRRPAVVARCTSTDDVVAALRWARESDLPIAVRGGGHSLAGHSTCDDGVVIDLGPMKRVDVDPVGRTAVAEAGLLWGEYDAATQQHGLASTGGEISHTGIAGLTLGGGIGWLKKRYGLACDHLLAAEVVTADGRVVRTSAEEHPDLHWALRGGGGNFGIVTRFTYRLSPLGPLLHAGPRFYPAERAAEVLRFLREHEAATPDDVTAMVSLTSAPPAPFLPEALHGQPIVVLVAAHLGPLERGPAALAGLDDLGAPLADLIGPMPYTALQRMVDDTAPHGMQVAVRSDFVRGPDDDAVDRLVAAWSRITAPLGYVLVHPLGGAVRRVPADATAFPHRAADAMVTAAAVWWDAAEDRARHDRWVREACVAVAACRAGTYVNHLGSEGEARVRQAYGDATHDRLAAVKSVWDPDNTFRLNQNIRPRTPVAAG
jgi:FAD/FMN-containing dehydrogenase